MAHVDFIFSFRPITLLKCFHVSLEQNRQNLKGQKVNG